jgi:hypothetical protein
MENVPDVLNYGGHNVIAEVAEALSDLGYVAKYSLINSAFQLASPRPTQSMAPSASRSPRLTPRWLLADTRTRSRSAKVPAGASTGSAISASPQTRARRANDYCSQGGRQPQPPTRPADGARWDIVAKRRDSRCRSDRNREWIKIKNPAHPAIEASANASTWTGGPIPSVRSWMFVDHLLRPTIEAFDIDGMTTA